MSEIRIQCDRCSQQLSLPASTVGKQAKCPKCETIFTVEPSPVIATPVEANPFRAPTERESTQERANLSSGSSSVTSPCDENNPPAMGLITIPLYISALLYFLIGLGVIIWVLDFNIGAEHDLGPVMFGIAVFSALLSFGLGGFIVFFTRKLRRRKKWAWITAIAFGGLYTPSAFIFLGVPILIGALKPEVQAWFNNDSPK